MSFHHETVRPVLHAEDAVELTDPGLACGRLPNTPTVRDAVWGVPAPSAVMSLLVYALDGGLDGLGNGS